MEEADNIKKIMMKRFDFEPKVDEYSTMTWTSKKYDIEVGQTASGVYSFKYLLRMSKNTYCSKRTTISS